MERRKFIESLPILSFLGTDFINSFTVDSYKDWNEIKNRFPKPSGILNLNSGSAGTMPLSVESLLIDKIKEMNRGPVYKVWSFWSQALKDIKHELGALINVSGKQIGICRNATEGLNHVIYGINLASNTNVVFANYDYPNVVKALEYRCAKEDINAHQLEANLAELTDNEIIQLYKNAINEQTSLVVITHLTHREGRVLPVREITKIAHQYGAKVLLDGAQSYSHFSFDLASLGVDYFATSLHKWFNAPLGTGFLFAKEGADKLIIHPLIPNHNSLKNIENFGTSAYFLWAGIAASIVFNNSVLPIDIKQARLQHLTQYWTKKLASIQPAIFQNHPSSTCFGIASFKLKNIQLKQLKLGLFEKYNINVKMVGADNGSYIRVSPNVFTLEEDLDYFVESLNQLIVSK